jgi:hypothetical protein
LKKKIKKEKAGLSQISFPLLKKLATTNRLKDILQNHIEKETITSVRNAWIEYFLEIKNKQITLKNRYD